MTKKRLRLIHKCWLTGLAIFLFLTSSNIIVSAVSLDLFSNTQMSIQHAFLVLCQLFFVMLTRHIREHARY